MNITTRTVVGIDTAKQVIQLYWVDMETGEIVSKQIKLAVFLEPIHPSRSIW
jgi:transposase